MNKAFVFILFVAAVIALVVYWPFPCKKCDHCCSCHGPLKSTKKTMYLINVLDKQMFDDAHIPGSVQIDITDVEQKTKGWDKKLPVVVYCSNYMCTASGMTAEKLQELGFENVYAYEAGMADWYQNSKKDGTYKVNGPAKEKYLEIVIDKPLSSDEKIRTISAQELHKMLKDASIL